MNIKIIEPLKKIEPRKRVCAYSRVSLDKESMLNSLVYQIAYYSKLIKNNPKWEYAGMYSDEGLTGTNANRPGFQKMVEDAKARKFDIVLVKSVSRFARNTVDLLTTSRLFKDLGIDVFFEEQNIHTLSYEGELLLSLYASFAQEESRSMSENIKWKIRKDMQEGKPPHNRALGYEIKNRVVTIIPDEAIVVKLVFALCLKGNGKLQIAKFLNRHGYRTLNNKSFRVNSVDQILTNLTYTGDLLLQKTYRQNHITKKKLKNNGEHSQYLVRDNHQGIISKIDFEKAQTMMSIRSEQFKTAPKGNATLYPFTHVIRCANCGGYFRRRKTKEKAYYHCQNKINNIGIECHNQQIPEFELYRMTTEILGLDEFRQEKFLDKVDYMIALPGKKVEFHFKKGTCIVKDWNFKSRAESWTKEMREQARKNAIASLKGANHAN